MENKKIDKWKCVQGDDIVTVNDSKITINNSTANQRNIKYYKRINITDKEVKQLKITFEGSFENAGGYLLINESIKMPFNSTSIMDVEVPTYLDMEIVVPAESSITFTDVEIEYLTEKNTLVDNVSTENDVLVITPNYPSLENLYYCAFVHSRVKEYINNGLKVQVASISSANWFQTEYTHEGVPVYRTTYEDLKTLLSRHQYKVIITHFVDENLYPIFDGYVSDEKLIFICHGPETVFRYLVNVTRPYFTKPVPYPTQNEAMDIKEKWVKKFSQRENVEWVFVSDWLKNYSEEQLGTTFKNARVINNIINEDLFPYSEKKKEDRCKILVIRKFDNIIQHSLDQVTLAILELSRRPCFKDLEFEIYGDGDFYDELVAPIKDIENVHFHRTFIPNSEISRIHKKAGILLIPSRHDAHAVAMGEGASSGLVVVGSNVTSNPFFMDEEHNHTLANPEDYIALADIIERLYNNPDEFLEISKRLSKKTRTNYCKANTVMKEVALIKEKRERYGIKAEFVAKQSNSPVLTIAIPSYNVEAYLAKTLNSIIRSKAIADMEILVVNDGSTDKTAEIAREYEKYTNGIVRLINKENGGHGSTINVSIAEAKGRYYRLVDGDDWVDDDNLTKLVEVLKTSNADVVLTKGSYEYVEQPQLVDIIKYDNLTEGYTYHFDDLIYEGYGFSTYGPLLTTGNYKTEVLKKANFKISEKKPYVDMEFNAFSLKYVDTLEYYNLDIYRYLIGRAGQTISRDYAKRKYKDHIYVIFNILEKVYNDKEFSKNKMKYILNNIIGQMVDSQIFMFDCMCLWNEIDEFLDKLKRYPDAYEASINVIEKKNGNCKLILDQYKRAIKLNKPKNPIVIPGIRETLNDLNIYPLGSAVVESKCNRNIKRAIKCVMPYGLLKLFRKIKNK
ncbi:MAG: glycosyltransferase [Clostridia bacterium]|nr:glycosyltransferase [Clostridia bacterium]